MKAIVMAGGKGSRMNLQIEKPLIKLEGKELISHVINALQNSKYVDSIIAVTSPFTAKTEEWLRTNKIRFLRSSGEGYVDDMRWVIATLEIKEPVIVCSSDVIFLDSHMLDEIIKLYNKSEFPALTVCKLKDCGIEHLGFNILDGSQMDREQKEVVVILNDRRLVNVNTIEDLKNVEEFMRNRDEPH